MAEPIDIRRQPVSTFPVELAFALLLAISLVVIVILFYVRALARRIELAAAPAARGSYGRKTGQTRTDFPLPRFESSALNAAFSAGEENDDEGHEALRKLMRSWQSV
jgi:hypothetical protein